MLPFKELNAVARLSVVGLFKDKHLVTDLSRVAVPVDYCDVEDGNYPEPQGAPPRPPSLLPPSASLHMELSLGEQLSHGRCGTVYRAKVSRVCDPDGTMISDVLLPPLVVKVAGRRYSDSLNRETWFYDEMETLQGSVIPRCFGLFEAPIDDGSVILPWIAHGVDRGRSDKRRGSVDIYGTNPSVPSPPRVSILLLEELGGEHLPLGGELTDDIKDQILSMFDEISRFRITHGDVRHRNILSAPRSPGAYPSLPSPYTGRTYDWRIFDFDGSSKWNDTFKAAKHFNSSPASVLLRGLRRNYIIEPWLE
ncbi:hypothetical protein PUNSTDRAFT_135564 [Punctularia strigosozonata HHB-11173 SS5]|uniref:uncharacterized protein n=1 Tax=Punctularia strigosozonata (strain HHB-11173) TaxID=741275 RepID=UPI0004417499|nr:uncharacterized protein PUNSTDRAFT_135564 [Punctularia strigosozonata HHB-11173 SS5]EIN08050.1 hypothetical protein PUNSTDRAFT_135564 [Punctularia strigosozonata HHB-11173 SS5]